MVGEGMQTKTHDSKWLPGRWGRVLTAVLVILILAPVPAFAFSFIGNWRFTRTRTGGAPPARTTVQDSSNGGSLDVNFGAYSARRAASSALTAVRDFRIRSSTELVQFAQRFNTLLLNGSIAYTIRLQQRVGSRFGTARTLDSSTVQAGANLTEVNRNNTVEERLRTGIYRLTITITYSKAASGRWDNIGAAVGSPHKLIIGGV
jgi:hypothetical protein